VMLDWFWAYLTYRSGTRLITGARQPETPPMSGSENAPQSRHRELAAAGVGIAVRLDPGRCGPAGTLAPVD